MALNRSTTSSDMLHPPAPCRHPLHQPVPWRTGILPRSPARAPPMASSRDLPASEVTISEPSRTFAAPFQVILSGAARPDRPSATPSTGPCPPPPPRIYSGPTHDQQHHPTARPHFRAPTTPAGRSPWTSPTSSLGIRPAELQLQPPHRRPRELGRRRKPGGPAASPTGSGPSSNRTPPPTTAPRCSTPSLSPPGSGVKRRGSSSSGWPKYSLTLEAQDEDGLDKGVKPLGLPRESDWVLSGRYQFDHALMRNPLIYRLSNEAGEYAVRTRFVEVFINVGRGQPLLQQRLLRRLHLHGKDQARQRSRGRRQDRSRATTPSRTSAAATCGRKTASIPGDSGFSVNTAWAPSAGSSPRRTRWSASPQESWLRNHLNEFDAALYASNWTHPTTGKHFTEYIDQHSWLRHHWCNTLAMNVDGFRLSGYYYKHRSDTNDGKVGAGPIWDFDRTMGSKDSRDNNPQAWDGTGDSSKTWERFPLPVVGTRPHQSRLPASPHRPLAGTPQECLLHRQHQQHHRRVRRRDRSPGSGRHQSGARQLARRAQFRQMARGQPPQ